MHLPNLLIIGSQKCGTTTLYDLLKGHPEIYMSPVKEVNFFTQPEKVKKGLSLYASYFPEASDSYKLIGEASPGYIVYPGLPEQIKQSIGTPKMILILREPVSRALSQYWDNRRQLKERLDFSDAVKQYLSDEYNPLQLGYFSRGVYYKYIERYLQCFDRSNLHIMLLEDLICNPEDTLKRMYAFLGVSVYPEHLKLNKSSNASIIYDNFLYKFLLNNPSFTQLIPLPLRKYLFFGDKLPYKYPPPSNETLNMLKEFYEPWNKKLESELKIDLSLWNK